ncbi:MAG: hypothetical protein ABSD68_02590 [Candidatus Micrarchaeales archaeon]|jgi:hypothetical protein
MHLYRTSERGKEERNAAESEKKIESLITEKVSIPQKAISPFIGEIEKKVAEAEERQKKSSLELKAEEKIKKEQEKIVNEPKFKQKLDEYNRLTQKVEGISQSIKDTDKTIKETENDIKILQYRRASSAKTNAIKTKEQEEEEKKALLEKENELKSAKEKKSKLSDELNGANGVKGAKQLADALKDEIAPTLGSYEKAKLAFETAEAKETFEKGELDDYRKMLTKMTGLLKTVSLAPNMQADKTEVVNYSHHLVSEKHFDVDHQQRSKDFLDAEEKRLTAVIENFGKKGSAVETLAETSKAGASYLKKKELTTSEEFKDKTKYRLGLMFGKKDLDEQFEVLTQKVKAIDYDKAEAECKEVRAAASELIVVKKALDIIKEKDIVSAKNYLAGLDEKDIQSSLPQTQVTKQQTSPRTELIREETAEVAVESIVKSYENRAGKLVDLIESLEGRNDTKMIRQINSGVLQMFVELQAINDVAGLSKEEGERVQSLAEIINGRLTKKAGDLGLETESRVISKDHSERVREHINNMMHKKSEEIEALSIATYNDLITIFSQAYKIKKEELEETLEDYVKRQKELKKTLRSRAPASNVDLSSPRIIKIEEHR